MARYYVIGPDNKSREISPEQYERLKMNRTILDTLKEGVGVKHDQGKPQYRLLPMAQLEGVVRVMEYGVEVYEEGDWKFVPDGGKRYLDAGLRHLAKHTDGHILDDVPDNKGRCSYLPHLDHAIASLIMARYFIFEKGFDDGGIRS